MRRWRRESRYRSNVPLDDWSDLFAAPVEDPDRALVDLDRHLAGLPTLAIGYMKRNLNAADHATLSEVLDLEALHMVRTMMTDDHKAAAQAFVDKAKPVFMGR